MGDYSYNRIVTNTDEKEQEIDFPLKVVPPTTGIYEGTCRYYKANIQWAKIIEGHVSWLATLPAWQDAENENYHAIQQILIFLQGIGTMEPNELTKNIRDGMYWAINDVAKQIVSGRVTDIAVDSEGNVSNPSESGSGDTPPPTDDPTTPAVNESKAAKYSSALAVTAGFNNFLAYIAKLFGVDATADIPLADALELVGWSYVIEPTMEQALDAYWVSRTAAEPQIASVDREDLANYIYCNPFRDIEDNVQAFIGGLVDTVAKKKRIADLAAALEETQWKIWQNTGMANQSTEYKAAPCEPVDTHQLLIQFNGVDVAAPSLKANHRYLIAISGYLQDTDGDIQDAFYHKQTGQTEVFDAGDFNIQYGQAVKLKPTQFEAPYSITHSYTYTLDMGAANATGQWTMARDTTMSPASTSPTNGLTVTIKDLGIIV